MFRSLLNGGVGFGAGGVGDGGEIRVGCASRRVGFNKRTESFLVVGYLHVGGNLGVARESVREVNGR